MPALKSLTAESPYTPWFMFVEGTYRLGGEALPYFSLTIQVKEAARFLSLARDVVFSPSATVTLEELFQRDLDEKRVRDTIIPYLKSPGKVKFFNSLTIALLPSDPDHPDALASEYATDPAPPEVDHSVVRQVGPVQFEFAEEAPGSRYGRLRWNTNLIRPVVLDGQHRFFALRSLYGDAGYSGKGELGETEIPVIVLVLAKDIGFSMEGKQGGDVLRTCRAIFIDLNKHALPVSKARQYLLDDRDLTAVAMRSILAQEISAHHKESVATRVEKHTRLPLAIVDWHSNKAKFDDGIYVTSLFNLYDLTSATLDLPAFKPEDYDAADTFIDRLTSRLHLSELRTDLQKYRTACIAEQVPFDLRSSDIDKAVHAFRAQWGAIIARPIVGLKPYAELISALEKAHVLTGPWENWCALDDTGKQAFQAETREMPGDVAYPLAAEIKATYPAAFQVVYQKAFVKVLIEMEPAMDELLPKWSSDKEVSIDRASFIDIWISRFNSQIAPCLTKDHGDVWLGAGRTVEGKVDFTQRGVRSIAGFTCLAMLAPLTEWGTQDGGDVKREATQWVTTAWGKIKKGAKANKIDHLLSLHGRHYRDSVAKILTSKQALDGGEPLSQDRLRRSMVRFAADRLSQMAAGCQSLSGHTETT